jgi:hypothetical protein
LLFHVIVQMNRRAATAGKCFFKLNLCSPVIGRDKSNRLGLKQFVKII